MALRWPREAHFELFWALVPEWLSDGLWRLILSRSGLWCQNGCQMASGLILSSSELWWPECLSDGLWRLSLSCSGLWCQNGSQMTSGDIF
jgi:hypothetical protein